MTKEEITPTNFTKNVLQKMNLLNDKGEKNFNCFFNYKNNLIDKDISRKDYLESITDRVFLFIQNDRISMQLYLDLVSKFGKNIHTKVGLQIVAKSHLDLKNIYLSKEDEINKKEVRCNAPLSTLIKSYAKHCE